MPFNIGRAVGNLVKSAGAAVNKTAQQIKEAEKKAEAQIKKAASNATTQIKTLTKGLPLKDAVNFAPLLPYYAAMKLALSKKGIANNGTMQDVATKFYQNIVLKSYEASYNDVDNFSGGIDAPLYNFDSDVFTYEEGANFDTQIYNVDGKPDNSIGKLLGGLVGGAIGGSAGTAAAVGTAGAATAAVPGGAATGAAVGSAVGGMVQSITRWFVQLIKAKKEGKAGPLGDVADVANQDLANTTAADAEAMKELAAGGAGGLNIGGMQFSTTTLIILAIVVAGGAYLIFKKK